MSIKRLTTIVIASAAALTFAGCSSTPSDQSGSNAEATLSDFQGSWGDAQDGQEPSLEIAEDGMFNGTDGCNSFSGQGNVADGQFQFGEFAITMMACPDVETWLGAASTATVSQDVMAVFAQSGDQIGTLDKAS